MANKLRLIAIAAGLIPATLVPIVVTSLLLRPRVYLAALRPLLPHRPLAIAVLLLILPSIARGQVSWGLFTPLLAALVFCYSVRFWDREYMSSSLLPSLSAIASASLIALAFLVLVSSVGLVAEAAVQSEVFGAGSQSGTAAASVLEHLRKWKSGWLPHENIWAAKVVVVGFVAVLLPSRSRLTVAAVALMVVSLLITGSRSATFGLIAGLLILASIQLRKPRLSLQSRRRHSLIVIGCVTAVVGIVFFGPSGSHFRAGVLIGSKLKNDTEPANLIVASEGIHLAPWRSVGVEVVALTGNNGEPPAVFSVTKTGEAADARAVIAARIKADQPYLLEFDMRSPSVRTRSGFRGWMEGPSGEVGTFQVVVNGGDPKVSSTGLVSARLLDVSTVVRGYTRVCVELVFAESGSIQLGPAPDMRSFASGATVFVSRVSLAPSTSAPASYVPTWPISASAQTAIGRVEIFNQAFEGFLEKPLFGKGYGAFFRNLRADRPANAFAVGHAHNLILQTLYELGLVGFTGLVLLLLVMLPPRAAGGHSLALLGFVIGLNIFDFTLWNAAVYIPVSFLAGALKSSDQLRLDG
jgi:O-antigen ligase